MQQGKQKGMRTFLDRQEEIGRISSPLADSLAQLSEKGKTFMNKIYICSPYRGDTEKNIENVKRYCQYCAWDGIPIAPHLYFTQFLDDNSMTDRHRGMRWGLELLDNM